MMRTRTVLLSSVCLALIGACSGSAEQAHTSLVAVVPEAAGANCPTGGQRISTGVDDDSSGVLDAAEIDISAYVCNGAVGTTGMTGMTGMTGTGGTDGAQSLLLLSAEPSGVNCGAGGQRIDYGVDDSGNGSLEAGEIDGTTYVCSPLAPLVATAAEAIGANCAAGGQVVTTGLDDNGSGVLDAPEVDSTVYVCNGADGAQSLITSSAELAGVNCVRGGFRVEHGIDDDGNGTLDPTEVDGTDYLCTALGALVSTSPEPAGGNCAAGGTKIESGLDDDGDGTLSPAEVDATEYACDGTNGLISLVASTPEAAGANCPTAGQRITTGVDDNSNGTLEPAEVDQTSYVCNGATTGPICDYFNRPNSTVVTGWTERVGDWIVDGSRLRDSTLGATYTHVITKDGSTMTDGCVTVTAVNNGTPSVTAVGVVLRWTAPNSYIVALLQDNTTSGNFNSLWIYQYPAFIPIGTPLTNQTFGLNPAMRVCVVGTTVTVGVDAGRDGTYETTSSGTTSLNGAGLTGIMTYSTPAHPFVDDFCSNVP